MVVDGIKDCGTGDHHVYHDSQRRQCNKNIPCRVTSNVTKGDTPPTQDLKKITCTLWNERLGHKKSVAEKIFGNSSKILPHHCS